MSEIKKGHNLGWFDKLRLNSWEVEILLVGFVLVILFSLPDKFGLELSKTLNSLSPEVMGDYLTWLIRLLVIFILGSIVNILIVSFSIYLAFRGFWVGVLGLSSVYPKGINLKRLNFNTIFHKEIEKYNFNDFIIKIDHICSSIFSLSFLISFSIISLCLFFIEFVLLATFLAKIISLNWIQNIILIPFLFFGMLFFIDYFFFGIIKKVKWKKFGYLFNKIDIFYKYITFVFVYDTLYYAFISNVKRRVIFLLVVGFILFAKSFESLELTKNTYFPQVKSSKNMMKYRHYEDKLKNNDNYKDNLYPTYPFIQSDIITQNYLKLHIPYHASMNKPIEKFCPEVSGFFFASDTSKINALEKEKKLLHCINNSYTIFINENRIENDFIFYEYAHPVLDIKSFFMLIPIELYSNGRHVLRIEKIINTQLSVSFSSDSGLDSELHAGADSITYIPFYLSR